MIRKIRVINQYAFERLIEILAPQARRFPTKGVERRAGEYGAELVGKRWAISPERKNFGPANPSGLQRDLNSDCPGIERLL